MVPDGTAFLQTLDTHFFSSFKSQLKTAKAHINELEEAGYVQMGQPYTPNCPPPSLPASSARPGRPR